MSDRFIAKSREELARLYGRAVATVQKWAAAGMPGEQGRYDIGDVIRWREQWWESRLESAKVDPSLVDSDSPAAERLRTAKAILAEMDIAERKGELVQAEAIRDGLLRSMAVIRDAGDKLQKDYGPGALEILNEAVDAALNAITEVLSDCGETANIE